MIGRQATQAVGAARLVLALVLPYLSACAEDAPGALPPLRADGDAVAAVDDATAGLPAASGFSRDVVDFGLASVIDDEIAFEATRLRGVDGGAVELVDPATCGPEGPIACRTLGSTAHVRLRSAGDVRFARPTRVLGLHVSLRGDQKAPLEALEPRQGAGLAFVLPQLRVLVTGLDEEGAERSTIRAIPASATYISTVVADDWMWIDTHLLGEVSGIRLRVESPIEGLDAVLVDNVTTSADYADDTDFFAVALLPDTQKYTEKPELNAIFSAQTAWIAAERAAERIAFASHLGDIVEHGEVEAEWEVADAAMATLDGVVPYGIMIGNHDFEEWSAPERGSPFFLQTFPESRYAAEPWWGGRAPDGLSSYQRFETPEGPFLYFHLSVDSPPPTVAWAREIIAANPGVPTGITTHVYLRENGRVPVAYMAATAEGWPGISADQVFDTLVAPHDQVFLVTCGHIAAEHLQRSENAAGHVVYEMLQDYQNRVDGGEGFLRLLRFHPRRREIRAITYSPWLDTYEVDADSHFTLAEARVPGWE